MDPMKTTDPATNRAALDFRRRVIDQRLSALDQMIGNRDPASAVMAERERNLAAERSSLRGMRGEICRIIGKPPKRGRPPKDRETQRRLRLLQREICARTEGTLWNATKREGEGDYRSARLHRLSTVFSGDEVCRELGIDPALLAFVDPPVPKAPDAAEASLAASAMPVGT